MNRRPLGSSGLDVPPVCLGTYTLAGAWAGDLDEAKAALRYGMERGLGFIDTAHAYGRAESALGSTFADVIAGSRDELVLCSKGGFELRTREGAATPFVPNSRPDFLRHCLTTSLRRLGADHLDVYLVHWFDPEVPVPDVAGAMRGFVDEGLVRAVGVSNYTVAQIQEFETVTPVDVVQLPYSLFSRSVESDILPYARDHDIGVMGYAALAQGFLTGTFTDPPHFADGDFRRDARDFTGERYTSRVAAARQMADIAESKGASLPDLAVAWVAMQQVPVIPMVGVQARSHVDALTRALDLELTDEDRRRLREIAETAPEMDFAGLVT